MKKEYVILTKDEIFKELDRLLVVNKRNIRKMERTDHVDYINVLYNSEENVDYLPTIKEWANNNNINLVVIDCKDKNDYSQYELEDLKKENVVLVVKNIYHVNVEFLNKRLLSTIENHSIINNKIAFENLIFVIGLNNDDSKSPDMKLTTLFGDCGCNYIED